MPVFPRNTAGTASTHPAEAGQARNELGSGRGWIGVWQGVTAASAFAELLHQKKEEEQNFT
jgi:hypothetical protein